MIQPIMLQAAIMAVMGRAVLLKNSPTSAEARAPQPIWKAPISAEALPAPLVKGAMASAAELGKVNPWQLRNKKMSDVVLYRFACATAVSITSTRPVADWVSNTTRRIWALLYFLSSRLLSWLQLMSPTAMAENIQPYCCSLTPYIS